MNDLDINELRDLFNRLLPPETQIPQGVTPETFMYAVRTCVDMADPQNSASGITDGGVLYEGAQLSNRRRLAIGVDIHAANRQAEQARATMPRLKPRRSNKQIALSLLQRGIKPEVIADICR